jgi:hypothetical protein
VRAFFAIPVFLLLVACAGSEAQEGFAIVNPPDVAKLRAAGSVTLLDANDAGFRAREGVIPGAVLLSNYKSYDVEKELPPAHDAKLVFYCANAH